MSYANELCGSKLRSKLGATLNESASQEISSTSFAARQMAKMGWTEGTGLGKSRNGMKSHIKVSKREDNIGIGQEKELAKEMSDTWWKNSVSSTLERLQQQNKNKKKKKGDSKSKKAKKHFTDEELFAATGGARFGMRAQRRAEGKWNRTEGISLETEIEAKNKMEWNGLGKAKLILSSLDSNTVSTRASEAVVSNSNSEEEQHDAAAVSKKRKRKKSDNIQEDTDTVQKKMKKEKKSKKTKKKKNKTEKNEDTTQTYQIGDENKESKKEETKSKKNDKKKSKKDKVKRDVLKDKPKKMKNKTKDK